MTQRFSMFRCMKCLATRYALTSAIPNAVTSVTMRTPNIGPMMLTTRRAQSIAQIFT